MNDADQIISRALDNAIENGYEKFVLEDDPRIVALDLIEFDVDVEGLDMSTDELAARICLWRNKRRD